MRYLLGFFVIASLLAQGQVPAVNSTAIVPLANGGTNADLSATGGTSQFLKQASGGAAITAVRPACADLSDAGAGCSASAGANAALSNLASVSVNSVLKFQTGIAVGDTTNPAKNLVFNASGAYGTGSYTFAGTPTANRTITLGDASITVARTDAGQTFTGTQAFGALTATTLNGNTFTTGTGALTIAAGKTLTANNTLTIAATDGITMTTPTTSFTAARTDAANSFTGTQTFGSSTITSSVITSGGNFTLAASGTINFGNASRSILASSLNGIITMSNAAATGFTRLVFGTYDNSTPTSNPGLSVVIQANPIIKVQDGSGGDTANLWIGAQKSTTGQRYVCIDTNGQLVSSAAACVGT